MMKGDLFMGWLCLIPPLFIMNLLGFNPYAFIETLPYMGKGMLGIFIVIGIIIICATILNKLTGKNKSKDNK